MGLRPAKKNEIKFIIRRKELWENDIGCIMGWNMTWDIHLSSKMVKGDVKIANKWKTGDKGAKIFKLGFLSGAMCTQERPCFHRILHMYAERILCMHKLKNKYTHWRTSLHTHEFKLQTQARFCSRKNKHRRLFFNIFQVFSTKTQPKCVPTPHRVSGFYLNPS